MTTPIEIIEAAVRDVNAGEHDSFGTLQVLGNERLWVQYMPGTINAAYPFDDLPQDRLAAFRFDEVMEWSPRISVTLEHFFEPVEVATWIDRYFREILGCDADYRLTWTFDHP